MEHLVEGSSKSRYVLSNSFVRPQLEPYNRGRESQVLLFSHRLETLPRPGATPRPILRRFEPGQAGSTRIPDVPRPPPDPSVHLWHKENSDVSVDEAKRRDNICVFCKNNGEPAAVYRAHAMKDNRGNVTCPALREYNCPWCNNGGGSRAHTVNYCPKKRAEYLNSFLRKN